MSKKDQSAVGIDWSHTVPEADVSNYRRFLLHKHQITVNICTLRWWSEDTLKEAKTKVMDSKNTNEEFLYNWYNKHQVNWFVKAAHVMFFLYKWTEALILKNVADKCHMVFRHNNKETSWSLKWSQDKGQDRVHLWQTWFRCPQVGERWQNFPWLTSPVRMEVVASDANDNSGWLATSTSLKQPVPLPHGSLP